MARSAGRWPDLGRAGGLVLFAVGALGLAAAGSRGIDPARIEVYGWFLGFALVGLLAIIGGSVRRG